MIDRQHKGLTSPDGITYRLVPLEWIIPNPENYNQHPREQIEALKADFKRFGQVKPYVVKQQDETRFMLSAGEGCTIAAGELLQEDAKKYEHLGWAKIVVVPDWWTDDDVIGFMTADNQTGRMSIPDEDRLLHILQRQKEAGYDLRSLGSDEEALRQMLANHEEENDTQELPDSDENVPLPEEEQTRVKPGDIWQLGRHRIGCMDALDPETYIVLLQGIRPHAIIADPPYGMRLDTDYSKREATPEFAAAKGVKSGRKYVEVIGDDKDFDATPLVKMFSDVKEQFWFGADYYSATLPDTMHGGCWIVWDKRVEESFDNMLGSCFELIWSRQKHKRDILRHRWVFIFGTEHEPQRGRQHPNQKPVRLIEDIITRYTDEGHIILDSFLGSGTSVISAERTGRLCYGCDLSPAYINVVIQRWEKETNQQAQLLERLEVPL